MTLAAVAAALLAGCSNEAAQDRMPANELASEADVPANDAANEVARPVEQANGAVPTNDTAAQKPSQPSAINPCLIQDTEPIPANRIRALGNEPFWNARVEGRCVTYTTPEDLKGTRIWARFVGTAEGGTWTGALDGKPFVLRTRPHPNCSDGMSDNLYPLAASLTVRGEERAGCAEPRSP